jgi:hypothetical protein
MFQAEESKNNCLVTYSGSFESQLMTRTPSKQIENYNIAHYVYFNFSLKLQECAKITSTRMAAIVKNEESFINIFPLLSNRLTHS